MSEKIWKSTFQTQIMIHENSDFLNLSAIYQYVNCNLEIIFGRDFICMHCIGGTVTKIYGHSTFQSFCSDTI